MHLGPLASTDVRYDAMHSEARTAVTAYIRDHVFAAGYVEADVMVDVIWVQPAKDVWQVSVCGRVCFEVQAEIVDMAGHLAVCIAPRVLSYPELRVA